MCIHTHMSSKCQYEMGKLFHKVLTEQAKCFKDIKRTISFYLMFDSSLTLIF